MMENRRWTSLFLGQARETAEQESQAMLLEEHAEHLALPITFHSGTSLLPQPLHGGILWASPDVLKADLG